MGRGATIGERLWERVKCVDDPLATLAPSMEVEAVATSGPDDRGAITDDVEVASTDDHRVDVVAIGPESGCREALRLENAPPGRGIPRR